MPALDNPSPIAPAHRSGVGYNDVMRHQLRRSTSQSAPREIVGESQVIRKLLPELRQIAETSARVLITGESGVGKELVAGYIHAWSPRAGRLFVPVNCAGLPETLLESELFGHVKGSFTGAYRDRPGKFELAHTATLFLDEVGEMSLRMQGLLLRVLETGEIQKVGADHWSGPVDCRVIAATNRNLLELVAQGTFRQDLYYRLNVIHIDVPPLRDRPEDIGILADMFLGRLGNPERPRRFSPEAHAVLSHYRWPGNVRQLENVVHRLAVTTTHETITVADLPVEIAQEVRAIPVAPREERRRTTADTLHEHLLRGASFWTAVYEPFIRRELTRADLRALIQKGLTESRGNYRSVVKLYNMQASEYKRFLNFLRTHDCLLPFRNFR